MLDVKEVEEAIQLPFLEWALRCHEVSLAIVKSGILPGKARVARGHAVGVISQHSWIVLGDNCYDPDADLIDPTLWSQKSCYTDRTPEEGIWYGTLKDKIHNPHGWYGGMQIWDYGRPGAAQGEPIELTPKKPFSEEAILFLQLLGPLDAHGWARLAEMPVAGWPAAEIVAAMDDTPAVSAFIPIDILGMLTDRNPNGLYF